MKKKAATRQVTVRNGGFIAAVKESVASRVTSHDQVAAKVRAKGVVDKLLEVSKKTAAK